MLVVLVGQVGAHPLPRPATVRGTLGTAPELVDIQTSAAYRAVGQALTQDAAMAASPVNPTSAAAASGVAIDTSMGGLGPIFLPKGDTLGTAGAVNVNVVGQSYDLDQFDGKHLLAADRPIVVRDPQSGALLGAQLDYKLALHVRAFSLAVTYALRDDLDVSLALPFSHVDLDLHVDAQIVRAARGDRFVRLRGTPTVSADAVPIDSFGQGDLTLRFKWLLPFGGKSEYGPTQALRGTKNTYTLDVSAVFPTGDVEQAHGSGTYFLNLGLSGLWPWALGARRGETHANAVMTFDLLNATGSQASYGVGSSIQLLLRPFTLIGVVEFLGRSQLDDAKGVIDTGVVVITSPTQLGNAAALGLDFKRKDFFDLTFGIRIPLGEHMLAFATALYPLNDAGLRPSGLTPTIGIGGNF